jgi:hypothetical protein
MLSKHKAHPCDYLDATKIHDFAKKFSPQHFKVNKNNEGNRNLMRAVRLVIIIMMHYHQFNI